MTEKFAYGTNTHNGCDCPILKMGRDADKPPNIAVVIVYDHLVESFTDRGIGLITEKAAEWIWSKVEHRIRGTYGEDSSEYEVVMDVIHHFDFSLEASKPDTIEA